jgi:HPt (histidine-containing phosphotransfer) domain-containing protein
MEQLASFAHNLKSTSATLGAIDLSEHAKVLELATQDGHAASLSAICTEISQKFDVVSQLIRSKLYKGS